MAGHLRNTSSRSPGYVSQGSKEWRKLTAIDRYKCTHEEENFAGLAHREEEPVGFGGGYSIADSPKR